MSEWEEILEYINCGPDRTKTYKELKSQFSHWPIAKFTRAFGVLVTISPAAVSIKKATFKDEDEYTATNAYMLPPES